MSPGPGSQETTHAAPGRGGATPRPPSARLVLLNRTEELERVTEWIDNLAQHRTWPEEPVFEFKLAVYEAVVNVVFYAFEDGGAHRIVIELRELECGLIDICIIDDGIPFDPTKVPRKPAPHSLREASINGRGIALFKALCDDVSYERRAGHNRLTLQRRLAKPAAEDPAGSAGSAGSAA